MIFLPSMKRENCTNLLLFVKMATAYSSSVFLKAKWNRLETATEAEAEREEGAERRGGNFCRDRKLLCGRQFLQCQANPPPPSSPLLPSLRHFYKLCGFFFKGNPLLGKVSECWGVGVRSAIKRID